MEDLLDPFAIKFDGFKFMPVIAVEGGEAVVVYLVAGWIGEIVNLGPGRIDFAIDLLIEILMLGLTTGSCLTSIRF